MVTRHSSVDVVRTTAGAGFLILPEAPWMRDALCAQTDPEAFFPKKGAANAAAKKICAACPARTECLEYALEHESGEAGTSRSYGPFGIYGGKTSGERRKLIRERQAARAAS